MVGDDLDEAVAVRGGEFGGERDDAVEFRLVLGGVPEDTVSAPDAVVEWGLGLAEDGAFAVGGEEVEVFINVVGVFVWVRVFVGRFGSPDFWREVNEE